MRFAYADPPYIGCAKKHYKDRPEYDGEVDHKALLEQLYCEFPDGWALSSHTKGLWDLVPMIPRSWNCRIAAWVKPYFGARPNVNPGYAWEPVIFRGGRKHQRYDRTIRDWIACNTTFSTGLPGAKPDEFCYWIFELLNMQPDDELVDLFPGTGRVTRAWEIYKNAGMELFA